MKDLAQLRADIAARLAALTDARDLEVVDRVVRVLIGHGEAERIALGLSREDALRVAVTPFEALLEASSLGRDAEEMPRLDMKALRASQHPALAAASETSGPDLCAEIEDGRRCARCLDPVIGGECGCPDLFGDGDDPEQMENRA